MREVAWVLAASILVMAFLADVEALTFLRAPPAQVALGALVVASFAVDPWAGVLLGAAALVALQRATVRARGVPSPRVGDAEPAVTPQSLHDMQTNVFSPLDYKRGMVGIRDPYGAGVYGAQGPDGPVAAYAPQIGSAV